MYLWMYLYIYLFIYLFICLRTKARAAGRLTAEHEAELTATSDAAQLAKIKALMEDVLAFARLPRSWRFRPLSTELVNWLRRAGHLWSRWCEPASLSCASVFRARSRAREGFETRSAWASSPSHLLWDVGKFLRLSAGVVSCSHTCIFMIVRWNLYKTRYASEYFTQLQHGCRNLSEYIALNRIHIGVHIRSIYRDPYRDSYRIDINSIYDPYTIYIVSV